MAMKKKMKGNITSPALPGKSILAEVNNNEAGNIYNSLFAKNRKVEYDNKYIALVNIRTNPDNQIFRVMDDDEFHARTLAARRQAAVDLGNGGGTGRQQGNQQGKSDFFHTVSITGLINACRSQPGGRLM